MVTFPLWYTTHGIKQTATYLQIKFVLIVLTLNESNYHKSLEAYLKSNRETLFIPYKILHLSLSVTLKYIFS